MKKLIIVPILSVCFLGASTKNIEVVKIQQIKPIDKLEYHPENKIKKLDSLMKEL